jgi:hypothetical protein
VFYLEVDLYSLALFQVVALIFNAVTYKPSSLVEQINRYEVVMFCGFPPESYSEELRKTLPPEKSILVVSVTVDGRFQGVKDGAMMEGIITRLEDGRFKVMIKKSQLDTTSAIPIERVVRPDEAVMAEGFLFSSIIFSFYFRVRSAAEGKKESTKNNT